MPVGRHIVRAALCGAALFSGGPAPAAAINPAALVPALDVYVDAVVAGHAAASCAGPKSPAADAKGWAAATAMFVATLWANGFPIDFVRTVTVRLAAPPPSGKPACGDPALAGELAGASREGWVAAMRRPLAAMDLTIVAHPVDAATWNRIKALISQRSGEQKRLLDCVAVSSPEVLPAVVHDWDQMLGELRTRLDAAGVPRDETSAALSAGDANALWHRVAPAGEAELRDSCRKDKGWQNRLHMLQFLGLKADVEKLLPGADGTGGGE